MCAYIEFIEGQNVLNLSQNELKNAIANGRHVDATVPERERPLQIYFQSWQNPLLNSFPPCTDPIKVNQYIIGISIEGYLAITRGEPRTFFEERGDSKGTAQRLVIKVSDPETN